jgi:hypothetical protein
MDRVLVLVVMVMASVVYESGDSSSKSEDSMKSGMTSDASESVSHEAMGASFGFGGMSRLGTAWESPSESSRSSGNLKPAHACTRKRKTNHRKMQKSGKVARKNSVLTFPEACWSGAFGSGGRLGVPAYLNLHAPRADSAQTLGLWTYKQFGVLWGKSSKCDSSRGW